MAPIPRSSNQTPKVSVVMTLYNRAREVEAALESVLAQDYDDFEVIVVDDGSTDEGPKRVRNFRDRVQLIERPNGGVAAARNTGLAAARGQYVAYCDSDDVQQPFRLAAQATLLDRFPQAAMVFSDFKTYDGARVSSVSHLRKVWLGPTVQALDAKLAEAFDEVYTCSTLQVPVPEAYHHHRVFIGNAARLLTVLHLAWGCVQMSRLEEVRAVGGHRESLRAYEDWALSVALAKRRPLIFLDVPTCLYRIHPGQLTGRPRLNAESYRDAIEHLFVRDPEFHRAHASEVDLVRGTAHAMLGELEATEGRWQAAEREFLRALASWPRLRRAYVNFALASLRHRLPGLRQSRLGRVLPPCVRAAR